MAFNWDDPNAVAAARQQAINSGYKAADIDKFISDQKSQIAIQRAAQLAQKNNMTLDQINSILPTDQKAGVVDELTKSGYNLQTNAQRTADDKKNQTVGDAKSLIQATLQNYLNVPQSEKQGLGVKAQIPLLNKFIAPAATEYEAGLKGEAPALGKVFGGQGSGLRITQAEINSWTPLLPSVHKTDAQNAADVQKLDTILKGRFGKNNGLDPEYLQQFGVGQGKPNTQQSSAPQQSAGEKLGGAAMGLLGAVLNPAIQYGKMLGGAGYEAVRAGASALGDKNAYNPDVHQNPFLSEQDLQKFQGTKGLVEGAKRTAGAAAYAIPFGKGASILTKALLPGAAVGGLAEASQPNATPNSIAGNALMGAAGAGLVHGALQIPKIAGGAGEALTGAGSNLRQGVSKIHLDPGLNSAAKEKEIQSTLDKLGITGNAQQKYEQIGPAANKLYTDVINPVLDKSSKPIPTEDIINNFTDFLDKNRVTLGISGKKAQQAGTKFMQDIYGSGEGGKILPDTINTDRLFQLKKDLSANNGMNKIFNKLRSADAAPLTDEEKVKLAAWKTLDQIITKQHPEIKEATKAYGLLKEAAPSLDKARNATSKVQILGNTIPSGIVQGARDLAGKTLQGAGGLLQTGQGVSNLDPRLLQIAGQIASRSHPR